MVLKGNENLSLPFMDCLCHPVTSLLECLQQQKKVVLCQQKVMFLHYPVCLFKLIYNWEEVLIYEQRERRRESIRGKNEVAIELTTSCSCTQPVNLSVELKIITMS